MSKVASAFLWKSPSAATHMKRSVLGDAAGDSCRRLDAASAEMQRGCNSCRRNATADDIRSADAAKSRCALCICNAFCFALVCPSRKILEVASFDGTTNRRVMDGENTQ